MSNVWENEFRQRMADFSRLRPPAEGEVPVSIKVGVVSGCYHAEHSPEAYAVIDQYLSSLPDTGEFEFVPHESGPELLVLAALGTAGMTLAKSVIDLVTAILKARSEGIRRGDSPQYPLRLKIRRTDRVGQFEEEVALELEWHDDVDTEQVSDALSAALSQLVDHELPPHS